MVNNHKESNIGDVDSNGDGNDDDGGNDEYVDGDEMMMIMRLVDDEDEYKPAQSFNVTALLKGFTHRCHLRHHDHHEDYADHDVLEDDADQDDYADFWVVRR